MEFNYGIRPSCKECEYKASGGGKCRALEEDVCPKDIWFHASKLELKGIRRSEQNLSVEKGNDVVPNIIKELLGEDI